MKTKTSIITFILTLSLATALFAGCAPKTTPPEKSTPNATPDTVTTASIVNNIESFKKAISDKGTWIIAITKDLSTDQPLSVDGVYKNGKKDANGNDAYQRKVALYAQDANRNITARYTMTAPKITFNSPYGSLEHGTFKGDVYVSAKNFKLVDQKIDGNLYFTTDEAQSTFTKDDKSTVTGTTALKK